MTSTGSFPEMLSQRIVVGRILVGRLGVRAVLSKLEVLKRPNPSSPSTQASAHETARMGAGAGATDGIGTADPNPGKVNLCVLV